MFRQRTRSSGVRNVSDPGIAGDDGYTRRQVVGTKALRSPNAWHRDGGAWDHDVNDGRSLA